MVAADVAELNNSLLKTVVSYTPIYGSRIDVSQAMEQAFRKYPRHEFVEHFRLVSEMWDGPTRSRDDHGALPLIYSNQPLMYVGNKGESFQASSSEPAFIMHLLAALDVQPGHRVLEIGCGTGWLLAMMAELSQEPRNVTGIEIIPELVKRAQVNLEKLGLGEVAVKLGDGNVLPTDIGSFDRVMYTASSFTFPTYLFDICQIGGKVVIPLRNRGLAEEVQILERTEQGFQATAARLCKFVQMTQRFGNDPSGITPSNEALRHNYKHADREPLDIPGGPPGTLAFSSFMSKTRPDFLVIGLNDPKIPSGFNAGVFGDPQAIGVAILANDWTAGAIWNRGFLRSFGGGDYRNKFIEGLSEWISCGQPLGAQLRLAISKNLTDSDGDNRGKTWREVRGDSVFTWSL